MKRLHGWDTYVREAMKNDRTIELPLTEDEIYVIEYPTRRQGREIARAQAAGDTDALLVAMLGEEAGTRVKELAEDQPAYVLDDFLIDVMKKFGMIPDDDNITVDDVVEGAESVESPEDEKTPQSTRNGAASSSRAAKGKATAARQSTS